MTLTDWILVAIFGAELIIIGYLIDLKNKREKTMKKRTKVEFIESYWKDGNTDYKWNDNHGELIRCKDCKHYEKLMHLCRKFDEYGLAENDFCSRGERKEAGE